MRTGATDEPLAGLTLPTASEQSASSSGTGGERSAPLTTSGPPFVGRGGLGSGSREGETVGSSSRSRSWQDDSDLPTATALPGSRQRGQRGQPKPADTQRQPSLPAGLSARPVLPYRSRRIASSGNSASSSSASMKSANSCVSDGASSSDGGANSNARARAETARATTGCGSATGTSDDEPPPSVRAVQSVSTYSQSVFTCSQSAVHESHGLSPP